ncbi:Nuclear pore complex protein Nup98-Nup96 [Mactra antiquata]
MFNKPTGFGTPFSSSGAATPGFGGTAFGQSTPSTGGLFGQNNTSTGGGLFGGSNTPAFGAQSSAFNFGSTPNTGGLFGQKTTANPGLFGTPTPSTSNAFAFGSSGGFGSTTTTASGGGLFGSTNNAGAGLFGNSAGFNQPQAGTVTKFNAPQGQDTVVKNGVSQTINTKHQCIAAMKEYEGKSLEELRVEDYMAGRKGKQAGTTSGFGFAANPTATQSSAFGFNQSKPSGFGTTTGFGTNTSTGTTGGLFGQQPQASTGGGGIFGQNKSLFGATATTTQSGFGFGANTSTGTGGLFGQAQQNKPLFGAATTTQSSLFGGTATNTFGTPAASTGGFGGFGTSQPGGLFANKPTFGAQTTSASGFGGFGTNTGGANNLFTKPFSTPSTGFGGFNTATTSTGFGGTFGANKPTFGLTTSSAGPAFSFGGGGGLSTGSSFFGNTGLSQPSGLGNFGATATGFGSFAPAGTNLGAGPSLGGAANAAANNQSAQLQQTLLALTHSPYGDSPLFSNMKDSSTKLQEVLKPTNPVAQKAALANQHKVSPRPMAKIKPKALSGVSGNGKAQIFEGLEDDSFSFGNDTFQPRKSVKKLTLKKLPGDSGTPSRASSVSGDVPNVSSLRDDGRSSPVQYTDHVRHDDNDISTNIPDTENIIRSKGIIDHMTDSPHRRGNMDDTIAILNTQNKPSGINVPVSQHVNDDSVNISTLSRDDSLLDEVFNGERPTTPPPPHPAGIVLTRPGYYTIPSLEALAERVDSDGNCYVEDFTIGREGYGSIYFPGTTNVANMNFDETVFFRRKELIVYPDDDNKPEVGEGLNKKAEITLDCVWPRDKTVGTSVKSPERLKAMRWQDKVEESSLKVGAKFIDYRPETGSWVFEVKHFSKYGLVDDSDDEDISEQDKKRLRTAQQQQQAVQKQKIHLEQQLKQKRGLGSVNGEAAKTDLTNQQLAKFTVGTDDDDSESSAGVIRNEMPMGEDDIPVSESSVDRISEIADEYDNEGLDVEEQPSSHRLASSQGVSARNMQVMKASFFADEDAPVPAFDGSLYSKRPDMSAGYSLLKPVENESMNTSLFNASMKSKYMYMSPVKLANLPQKETGKDRGLFSPRLITPEPIRAVDPNRTVKSPQTMQAPVKEYMMIESGMKPHDYQPKLSGINISNNIPVVTSSYTYNRQNYLVDAGLYMGRSFRVGWGPGGMLAHCGDIIQPKESEQEQSVGKFNLFSGDHRHRTLQGSSSWNVHLQKVKIADHIQPMDQTVIKNHCEMLEIQLVHSRSTKEGQCPVFTPSLGVEALHQYAESNHDELESLGGHPDEASIKHMGMIWDLCVALWGNLPELKDLDIDKDSYMHQNARREAFSRWLTAVSGEVIRKEQEENKYKDQGHLQAILSSLTGHQISLACEYAQKSGDHRLALLLSQAVSAYIPRQIISGYIDEMMELNVENFFHETRLKIYGLLAGKLVLSSSSVSVNACDGVDWKRAVGLHLWFGCKADSPIQEAIEMYDRSYHGTMDYEQYCCAPLPPYLEQNTNLESIDDKVKDTCYHILCLYCQRCHQLEQILNPTTSTISHLDYRMSWHLSQVLQSLSYNHLSAYHKASLHINFAFHLESLDLWEWAVFVVLHIENPISREAAVRSLLNRHAQLSTSEDYLEKEALLINKLLVPKPWIHTAKALRANYEGNHKEEAYHLLKAGKWNKSHDVIMKHIASDAIIHEQYDYLLDFLEQLAVQNRCLSIIDWEIAGRIYLQYINICNRMKELSQNVSDPDLYSLDQLLPEVKSLCNSVRSIPCRNSKDRLCQSEMAKKAANYLRLILTFQAEARGEERPTIRMIAPYISNLPMPEDYTQQELRSYTRNYMMEYTAA